MSIANVICEGYGPQASIANVILGGYSIGAAAAVPVTLMTEGLGFGGRASSIMHGGLSCYLGLAEPPPTGKNYQDIDSLIYTGYSLLLGDPAAQLGDVFITDQVTQKTAYPLVVNTDGTGFANAGGDTTRQLFTADIWNVGGQTDYGAFTVAINNHAPQQVNPVPTPQQLPVGQAYSIDFAQATPPFVIDPDGDPLTLTVTGLMPPGLSYAGTAITGTPTTIGLYPVTLNFSDPYGGQLQIPVSFNVFGLTVTVPDFTGQTFSAAFAAAAADNLTPQSTANGVYSNTIAVGLVVQQSLTAGSQVAPGTAITFFVSLGPNPSGSPYTSYDQAVSEIVNAGLILWQPVGYVNDPVIPRGYVVAQVPPGLSQVLPNAQILLTVSLGPALVVTSPTVGNYVGRNYLSAMRSMALNNIGTTNPVFQNSSTVPDTTVIAQSIAAGTVVPPGTIVTLTVSMGVAPVFPSTQLVTVPKVTYP